MRLCLRFPTVVIADGFSTIWGLCLFAVVHFIVIDLVFTNANSFIFGLSQSSFICGLPSFYIAMASPNGRVVTSVTRSFESDDLSTMKDENGASIVLPNEPLSKVIIQLSVNNGGPMVYSNTASVSDFWCIGKDSSTGRNVFMEKCSGKLLFIRCRF